VGGVYSFSFGEKNFGMILKNMYYRNVGDIGGVFDIDFRNGWVLLLEELFIENYGYNYNKLKIGSASMAVVKISNQGYFIMINTISNLNWCEMKGTILYKNLFLFNINFILFFNEKKDKFFKKRFLLNQGIKIHFNLSNWIGFLE
jgi:hypothetical protein